LKRHGYYCRSRTNGRTTRSRSCICCAKRKARCDHDRPQCSRCKGKGIECRYPASASNKHSGQRSPIITDTPNERGNSTTSLVASSPSPESHLGVSDGSDTLLDDAFAVSASQIESFGDGSLDWNYPNIDLAGYLDPKTKDGMFEYSSLEWSPTINRSTFSTNQALQAQPNMSYIELSIPLAPNSNIRKLIQRPQIKTGTQRTANLILYTLKSYPRMLLRPNTLPPFIHPYLISSEVDSRDMESLINCISLVHMINSGVQGNRKLFWKNVRLECERMYAEVSLFVVL